MNKLSLLPLALALSVVASPARAEKPLSLRKSQSRSDCQPINGPIQLAFQDVGDEKTDAWVSGTIPESRQIESGEVLVFGDQVFWAQLKRHNTPSFSGVQGRTQSQSEIHLNFNGPRGAPTGSILLSDKFKKQVREKVASSGGANAAANACVSGMMLRSVKVDGKDAVQVRIHINKNGNLATVTAQAKREADRFEADRPTKPSDLEGAPAAGDGKGSGATAAEEPKG